MTHATGIRHVRVLQESFHSPRPIQLFILLKAGSGAVSSLLNCSHSFFTSHPR